MQPKTIEAPVDIATLAEAARREPVTVMSEGRAAFVAVSPMEFERLEAQERIRREAKARLRRTMAEVHAEAAARGLTETKLARLLVDES